jgi:hypothetical protein
MRPIMPALPEHWPQIEALLERFEGPTAVEILNAWRGPHSDTIVICEGDAVLGFATGLRLDSAPAELIALDPGTAALARVLFDERGLSRQRATYYYRFWSGPNHHLPSRAQAQIFLHFLLLATSVKELGAIASAHHPPAYWRAMHHASAHEMFESAAFSLDGHDFMPFGRDFTTVSRRKWIIEHFQRMFEVRHAIGAMLTQRDRDETDRAFDADLLTLGSGERRSA